MRQYGVLMLALVISTIGLNACRESESVVNVGTTESCDTSSDCAEGMGCLVIEHKCYPLTTSKQCNGNQDCPEDLKCYRTSEDTPGICSISCESNDDCSRAGREVLCHRGVDITNGKHFCSLIPGTCGNGKLDPGEVCDVNEKHNAVFAKSDASCTDWNSSYHYKPGGRPGCASDCLGYSKGSGKTKCVDSDARNNVNGFDTCLANLFIDYSNEKAYATVNYTTSAYDGEDKVAGAILCLPPDQKVSIAVTGDNMPDLTLQDADCNTAGDRACNTLLLERDLKPVGAGAEEIDCIVYLAVTRDGNVENIKKGAICELVYSDIEKVNVSPDDPDALIPISRTHVPSDALRSQNACVTLYGECDDSEIQNFEALNSDEEKTAFSCVKDDYFVNDAYIANQNCRISDYPYVALERPENAVVMPVNTVVAWDAFSGMLDENGKLPNTKNGVALLKAGLAPDEGLCTKAPFCTDIKLSMVVEQDENKIQKATLTKNSNTDSTQIGSMPMDTLIIGPFAQEMDYETPLSMNRLEISGTGLDRFRNLSLRIVGKTAGGKIAVGYTTGDDVIMLYKDLDFPTEEVCSSSTDPEDETKTIVDVSDPPLCYHPTFGEATLELPIAEEAGVTAIYILMSTQAQSNIRFNSIVLTGASTVIY